MTSLIRDGTEMTRHTVELAMIFTLVKQVKTNISEDQG